MNEIVKAVYEGGAFVPELPFDLPEGTEVILTVARTGLVTPPEISSSEERRRILRRVVERMQANPLPAHFPRFTRDEMHDRG